MRRLDHLVPTDRRRGRRTLLNPDRSHGRGRAIVVTAAMAAALLVPQTAALASHVGSVSITPSDATLVTDVCGPFVVQTKGGTAPIGAVVDVEVVGVTPVQFCLPAAGVNPVLIDPTTGDLGDGTDGTVGGEAIAGASSLPDEGDFTFGIISSGSGSFDITVFVEEPGGPNDNDDPDTGEPTDGASATVGSGGGGGGGKVGSTVTLTRKLNGKVRSSDPSCVEGRKIVVKKVRRGRDRVVGRDVSERSGAYRVRARNLKGRFYAIAKRKVGGAAGGGTCLRSRSKKVKR